MIHYLNMNSHIKTGDYEIHSESCHWLQFIRNTKFIGNTDDKKILMEAAKKEYSQITFCQDCCK